MLIYLVLKNQKYYSIIVLHCDSVTMSQLGWPATFNGTVGNRGGPQITDIRQYGIEKARYDAKMSQQRDNGSYKKK
jgi:hypothetical protein